MKRLLFFILFLFAFCQAQTIYTVNSLDEPLNRMGVTKDLTFQGKGNVFYKETSSEDWHFLLSRNLTVLMNDTLEYWSIILDNESDSLWTVMEYQYKEITWEPEGPMCLVAWDWLHIENACLCVDNNGGICTIYIIIHDNGYNGYKDWWMYTMECDTSIPF